MGRGEGAGKRWEEGERELERETERHIFNLLIHYPIGHGECNWARLKLGISFVSPTNVAGA